jgi:hypothetical protein
MIDLHGTVEIGLMKDITPELQISCDVVHFFLTYDSGFIA